MKKQKLNIDKKLFLNKEKIAQLDAHTQQNILGGSGLTDAYTCPVLGITCGVPNTVWKTCQTCF